MMMMCARAINVRLSGLMRYVRNLEGALRRTTANVSASRSYLKRFSNTLLLRESTPENTWALNSVIVMAEKLNNTI